MCIRDSQYTALQEESERILQQKTEVLATLHTQEENQKQAATLKDTLDAKTKLLNQWSKLDDLIGSQSGYTVSYTHLDVYKRQTIIGQCFRCIHIYLFFKYGFQHYSSGPA